MIDLTDKSFVIFGLRGSGKSWLVKNILDSTPDHIIYDPLGEHKGYRQYIPDDRDSTDELSEMIQGLVIKKKPSLFIIDEANKYIPPKPTRLCPGVADLVDFSRHWKISFGAVARRMSHLIPISWNYRTMYLSLTFRAKMIFSTAKRYTVALVLRFGVSRRIVSLVLNMVGKLRSILP